MPSEQIEVNDVVQIVDQSHKWFPAMLTVAEYRPHLPGREVMGFTVMVNNTEDGNGQAYIFVAESMVEKIGRAVICPAESEATDAL